ncbi:hypothetical protein THAOC_21666 [Thalassiosira oceanica]|uniref:Uncharacterized protein n=1 Tax=Thalassiosira oceanica TaxID=159749 RepID=K0S0N8_THAOC|nr:hypothetical protein THAOC_21666 [Thalassiosira oceanica]|eukprot:EJK58229.1 hypothetical protein THAOC_21666 [Thalassiosira oceanica]
MRKSRNANRRQRRLLEEAACCGAASFNDSFQPLSDEAYETPHDSHNFLCARFSREEIEVGKKLGSGGYSDVYEVKSFKLNNKFIHPICGDMSSVEMAAAGWSLYTSNHCTVEAHRKSSSNQTIVYLIFDPSTRHPHFTSPRGLNFNNY